MFARGLLNKHVGIWVIDRERQDGKSGRGSGGVKYKCRCTVWGGLTYSRGMKAMREGALEAYDVVMVRMDFYPFIDRDCRLTCDGKTYQILQLNSDQQKNEIQITAQETNERLGL